MEHASSKSQERAGSQDSKQLTKPEQKKSTASLLFLQTNPLSELFSCFFYFLNCGLNSMNQMWVRALARLQGCDCGGRFTGGDPNTSHS